MSCSTQISRDRPAAFPAFCHGASAISSQPAGAVVLPLLAPALWEPLSSSMPPAELFRPFVVFVGGQAEASWSARSPRSRGFASRPH